MFFRGFIFSRSLRLFQKGHIFSGGGGMQFLSGDEVVEVFQGNIFFQ